MSKILIIDAEECIRYTFKYFLMEEGYEAHTAQDYEEALSLIKYSTYDLIFFDAMWSVSQNIEQIRTMKRANNCPIVVITGTPDNEEAVAVLAAGAFDYLPKPLLKEKILHITANALHHEGCPETFHKILKSGRRSEDKRLGSLERLERCLAVDYDNGVEINVFNHVRQADA